MALKNNKNEGKVCSAIIKTTNEGSIQPKQQI